MMAYIESAILMALADTALRLSMRQRDPARVEMLRAFMVLSEACDVVGEYDDSWYEDSDLVTLELN